LDSDIVCFQEVKVIDKQLPTEYTHVKGFDCFYSLCTKRAYSGLATFVRKKVSPVVCEFGFTGTISKSNLGCYEQLYQSFTKEQLIEMDSEARVLITDHAFFVLFNVYYPALCDESRLYFKMNFSKALQTRIDALIQSGRNVIVVGDVNIAHNEIDHCDPLQSIKENGIVHFGDVPHRIWLNEWLLSGLVIDSFRLFHPERKNAFTCWNTLINARPANYGTRIDYIFVSPEIKKWLSNCDILVDILGSDHCPVYIELLPTLDNQSLSKLFPSLSKPCIGATYYWSNFGGNQTTLESFFQKRKHTNQNPVSVAKVSKKQSLQKPITNFIQKSTSQKSELIDDFPLYDQDKFAKTFNAISEWKQIMGSKNAPKCFHGEVSKETKATKPGPNKGKMFYVCARLVGSDPNGRCNFFAWK
jgi:AP endonuclease-2